MRRVSGHEFVVFPRKLHTFIPWFYPILLYISCPGHYDDCFGSYCSFRWQATSWRRCSYQQPDCTPRVQRWWQVFFGRCQASFESALFYQLFTKVFLSHVSTILKLASMISKALSGCNNLVRMLHDRVPAYLSYLLVQFCSGGLTSQWETSSSLKENANFQQICSHWPHRVKLVDAMWTPQIWMGKAIWNWKNLWNVHNNSCDMLQLTSPYWIKQSQTCLLYEVKL